jgi:hypothetical protein
MGVAGPFYKYWSNSGSSILKNTNENTSTIFFSLTFGFFSLEKKIPFSRLTCWKHWIRNLHVNLEKEMFFSWEKNPKVEEKNILDVFLLVFRKQSSNSNKRFQPNLAGPSFRFATLVISKT